MSESPKNSLSIWQIMIAIQQCLADRCKGYSVETSGAKLLLEFSCYRALYWAE